MPGDVTIADRLLGSLEGLTDPPVALAAGAVVDGEVSVALSGCEEHVRFEFGSITKTMTAQVLATLVVDGTVALDDPVDRWLDAGANGSITLGQLATHTSGLPRIASNSDAAASFNPLDPYAAYTEEMAEAALATTTLEMPGESAYSNFGFQVLGVAIERAADAGLADLFERCVFAPFGMSDAAVFPADRMVVGYQGNQSTPTWTVMLPGPGGVVGTINDLLAWGRAVATPPQGRHGDAVRLARRPMFGDEANGVGLAWHFRTGLAWHNGGTSGGRASLAVELSTGRVAAALAAGQDFDHIDDAVARAALGADPCDARPEPGTRAHDDAALAVALALVAQDWPAAQRAMSDQCRAALTEDRLAAAWHGVMAPRGDLVASEVTGAVQRGSATEVNVTLTFGEGAGWAKVVFNAGGQVVGLLIG